jgi:hypothetical protein
MGLTLHYRLTAPAGCTARRAEALVRRFHAIASGGVAAGRVVEVGPSWPIPPSSNAAAPRG